MKIEYPKVLYHATEPPQTVADPDKHAAAGPGWFESPGEADDAALEAATAPDPEPVIEEPKKGRK